VFVSETVEAPAISRASVQTEVMMSAVNCTSKLHVSVSSCNVNLPHQDADEVIEACFKI
jgi:hypothetical protein